MFPGTTPEELNRTFRRFFYFARAGRPIPAEVITEAMFASVYDL